MFDSDLWFLEIFLSLINFEKATISSSCVEDKNLQKYLSLWGDVNLQKLSERCIFVPKTIKKLKTAILLTAIKQNDYVIHGVTY